MWLLANFVVRVNGGDFPKSDLKRTEPSLSFSCVPK